MTTPIVTDGAPAITIITPASCLHNRPANAIRQAIRKETGATVPITADDESAAAFPLPGHAIVLGNRSTNNTMSALYDKFYTLVDIKYPGLEGFVLRTVHNPLGDGKAERKGRDHPSRQAQRPRRRNRRTANPTGPRRRSRQQQGRGESLRHRPVAHMMNEIHELELGLFPAPPMGPQQQGIMPE